MLQTRSELAEAVRDARERTFALVADLTDERLMGPRLSIINPLLWEIGHVAWFQEKWALRHALDHPPIREDADALYDSMAIPHDSRWDLPLANREQTLRYLGDVRDAVLDALSGELTDDLRYFVSLGVLHEDMHDEAFTYTRQTLGYPAPDFADPRRIAPRGGPLAGDADVPGGEFSLGASADERRFIFDNEKWQHPVTLAPFRIARAAVTQADYAGFVEEGGYLRREFWTEDGWAWRERSGAEHPVYWRRTGSAWERRHFNHWLPLEPFRPVVHVNWHEASAYCRWAGRRLPTEAEWEFAAAWDPAGGRKRLYPWGDEPPSPERANLDWRAGGCIDVGALRAGDSAFGCRQMLGNVWEWTSTPFGPFPGFAPDPYKEYSEPWFGDHFVLRGGCWTTRSRLVHAMWRNFYRPDRRDVWAGFRTCALG